MYTVCYSSLFSTGKNIPPQSVIRIQENLLFRSGKKLYPLLYDHELYDPEKKTLDPDILLILEKILVFRMTEVGRAEEILFGVFPTMFINPCQ